MTMLATRDEIRDGVVYTARRPFHPQRFWRVMQHNWPSETRIKGFVWLAASMTHVSLWTWTEGRSMLQPAGHWWAARPEGEWPEDEQTRREIRRHWHPQWGDRRQEIVLLGQKTERQGFTNVLNAALLTRGEIARGVETDWTCFFEC